VIDITHGIPPQHVLQGALVLADTLPYMPVGIHVAVIDPGVGSRRNALVLEGGDGRLYVGPDNGLLVLAAERLGGIVRAVEIVNRSYMLEPVSHTFHGRDVFAPAAAHLALGVPLEELGPSVEPEQLVRLAVPKPEIAGGRIRATVLHVDRFGNVQLNMTAADLATAGIVAGARLEIEVGSRRYSALAAQTFADVRPGAMVLYEDAYWNAALAVNGGNAAATLRALVGQEVALWPAAD
jgi:S-adenosylmethionine hydrolase